MSAKVYNPMILSEIATIRSPALLGRRPVTNTSRITAARVKRDLFGPVDKEDSKKFIERELAAQNEVLSKKWGFDFHSGEPMRNHDQYQWERVPPTSAPACFINGMVTLTQAAHVVRPTASESLLDQRAERENANCFAASTAERHLMSPSSSSDSGVGASSCEPVRTHPLDKLNVTRNSRSTSSSFPASITKAQRQQRITDFLKERKRRTSSSPKISPVKRARHGPGSSSSQCSATSE